MLADGVCVGHVWLAVGGCCCVSSCSCEFLYSVSLTELGVVISGDAGVVDELGIS